MNRLVSIIAAGFLLFGVHGLYADPSDGTTNAPPRELSRKQLMTDPKDGDFDMSRWLMTAQGFLPVPIIITEPAVGYGGGLSLMFLSDSIENRTRRMAQDGDSADGPKISPPDISGAAAFGTENGTWGGGLFHKGFWRKDTLRYTGALGYVSVNYDYYGTSDQPLPPGIGNIPVNIKGSFLFQELMFRIRDSNFFAGANYKYFSSTASPDTSFNLPPPAGNGVDVQSGGASGLLEYDSRDNIFTPNRGYSVLASATFFEDWLGSDNRFETYFLHNRGWFQIRRPLVLGVRLDGDFCNGDTPFYMEPYVNMRGVPAMRFQGESVLTAEAELRWDVTPRWSAIGFAGSGWSSDSGALESADADSVFAYGFGFRYLVARLFNLRAGLDFGFSEEDSAFYIIMGNAWGR